MKSRLYLIPFSRKEAAARLKLLKKFDTGPDLIEFGSNSGEFLWVAAKAGFKVTGVDLYSSLLNINKVEGLNFIHSDAHVVNLQKEYDVIAAFHFLEHFENPLFFLRNLKKSLKKNGVLFFEVPNYNSRSRIKQGEKWQHLFEYHVSHFNISSLTNLLESCGFRVLYSRSFQPIDFLVDPFYLPLRHWLWGTIKSMLWGKGSTSTYDITSIVKGRAKTLSLEEEMKIHQSFKAKLNRFEIGIKKLFSLAIWPYAWWLGKIGQGDVIQVIATHIIGKDEVDGLTATAGGT